MNLAAVSTASRGRKVVATADLEHNTATSMETAEAFGSQQAEASDSATNNIGHGIHHDSRRDDAIDVTTCVLTHPTPVLTAPAL
jgi:hypothetical protein